MSYTGMRAAFEDGIMGEAAEFQNAWRGAMFIWIYMCRKYLNLQYMPMSEAECEKVWALAKDPRVSRQDRLAFMSTFDNILLGPDLMLEVADALDSIPEVTDNVRSQAIWIRKMHARGARAIGWRQTSVIADPWWDRDKDEPYNIDTGTKHKWIALVDEAPKPEQEPEAVVLELPEPEPGPRHRPMPEHFPARREWSPNAPEILRKIVKARREATLRHGPTHHEVRDITRDILHSATDDELRQVFDGADSPILRDMAIKEFRGRRDRG